MKQKLLKSMLLLCILVGGVCSAWGEDVVAYTLTPTTNSATASSAYDQAYDFTINSITWNVTGNTNMNPWRIGGKKSTINSSTGTGDRILYSKGTISDNVTKIEIIHGNSNSDITVNSITLVVSTAENGGGTIISTLTGSYTNNKTTTFIRPNDKDWTGRYYKIVYNVTNTTTTQKFVLFSEAKFYKEGGGSTPSITANDVNIAYNAENGSIAYTLNNATGNVTASVTSGNWLTLGTVTASAVPFTCSANTTTTPRTAQVTLSFTGATDKAVTVTQAAAPFANIAALTANTEANTYNVTLTDAVVTYVNGNYAYIQDASGAVVLYKSSHGLTAGKVFNGTATVAYQLKNSNPQITDISGVTPTSGDAPAPTAVAQSAWAYTFSDVLSQYFKITDATITQSDSKYYVSLGGQTIQLYKAGGSISSLDLTKKYNITGFPTLYGSTKEIQIFADPEEVQDPTITTGSNSLTGFTYAEGEGPSTSKKISVSGTNLTANISLSLGESSDYEMCLSEVVGTYTNSLSLTQTDGAVSATNVYVRLKSGLAQGVHNGTLTLSSTGATSKNVSLSGSVTGPTYDIHLPDKVTGGTIEADYVSAEEGTTVTLTAHPDAAYTFGSWTVIKSDFSAEVTVTNNQFTMPNCDVLVSATFNAKPTYAITCVADPVAGGTIVSDDNAYEGKTVTISYEAASGYELSSIVITKTSDGSATGITPTKSGDDYTFTMPGYAVTATASFETTTYNGTFALYSGDLTEGDYILVYNGNAMNNSVSNNKFGQTGVTISSNTISNPLRSIVWHIAPSATTGYWTIYNAKKNQYACGTESSTNVSLISDPTTSDAAIWSVSGTYDFRCKDNEGQSTARYLRVNSSVFGNYASSNGGALTLYKYTVLTPRTITFNGNGGTYNEATTYTQDVYDGVEATLDANKFTRSGYEFVAWNNQADGNGATSCDDVDKITVTGSDLTLYAQWAPLYTLTIDNSIEGGSVAVEGDLTSSVEGVEITLTYTPSAGYGFSAWNVYKAGDTSTKITVTDNKFTMPDYNVVISATFEEVQTYSLVTNIAQLVPGKHYIIASGTNGSVKAIGSQNTNNRTAVGVTATSGIIPETDGVYEFVIYGPDANGYYTIYDETETEYLYAASSSANNMKTQSTNNANGKWTIAIANTGVATVKAQGNYTRNWMQYNSSSTLFSCYGSSQADIYLYVKDGDTPVATTTSVKLNAYGYATFASASALDFLDADADGIEYSAWQITGVTNSAITFDQIKSTVAAGKGILLKGTPNATINLNILPVGGATLSGNKLMGITTATAVAVDTYYGLSGNKFVKVNAGTVPAGKALLPASVVSAGVKAFTFVFEGEDDNETAICGPTSDLSEGEGAIYDLSGRRVQKPTKGLYIVNGKKVMK